MTPGCHQATKCFYRWGTVLQITPGPHSAAVLPLRPLSQKASLGAPRHFLKPGTELPCRLGVPMQEVCSELRSQRKVKTCDSPVEMK